MHRLYSTLLIVAALCAIFFTSCTHDSMYDTFETGGDFTQSNVKIVQIDTFAVNMSTFRYDSISSTGNSRLLVGRYVDPVFGEVKASAFADFVPATFYFDADAVFDSIVLNLPYDGYYYNDTLAQKTINIQQLTKEIRLRNNQTDLYNTTNVATASEIIGTKSFYPRISKDSLTIRMADSFGQNLFNKIQHDQINDVDQLTDYFKGLKISPSDTEDASVIGFNVTKSYMRVYYSIPDDVTTESQYVDFVYYTTTDPKFFNQVAGNRAGTLLANLNGQENEAKSTSTNNLTFIQSGIGVTTKVTFPSIRNIYQVNNNNGEIFKANLKIRLNNAYFNNKLYTNDSIGVFIADQNNDLVAQLTNSAGNAVMGYIDKSDNETNEVYLNVPVQPFLEKMINNAMYLKYGLVFFPAGYTSAVNRLVLNGENNSIYKTRLELTYTIYDK